MQTALKSLSEVDCSATDPTWNPSSPEGSPLLSPFPVTDPPQSSYIVNPIHQRAYTDDRFASKGFPQIMLGR